MIETFNRPFETCIRERDGSSIMCSFNNINGIPVIAKRQKWLHDSLEDAIAQTLKVGLDLDCGWGGIHYYQTYGESAVQQGKVRETNIDNALMNIYTVLMRLGFFDGNPRYDSFGLEDICTEDSIELDIQEEHTSSIDSTI
ncbi:hypothetical protein J5N97_003946 [Dioscorea zingiberensis]|uniref:Uncharacterized protein n=1 Tax=Dioscorea zingiberensis TaxID=325984 RepID=A0A9D5HQI5_9LILI|nr:hypothetical protein J5N97_003946 [Dioscorea zingiberensis]